MTRRRTIVLLCGMALLLLVLNALAMTGRWSMLVALLAVPLFALVLLIDGLGLFALVALIQLPFQLSPVILVVPVLGGLEIRLNDVLLLLLLFGTLLRRGARRQPVVTFSFPGLLVASFVLLLGFTLIRTYALFGERAFAFAAVTYGRFAEFSLFFFIAWCFGASGGRVRALLLWQVAWGAFQGGVALLERACNMAGLFLPIPAHIFRYTNYTGLRSTGIQGDPDSLAALLIFPLFISLAWLLKRDQLRLQPYRLAVFLLIGAGVLLTQSRGVMAGVLVALGVFCFVRRLAYLRIYLVLAMLVTAVAGYGPMLARVRSAVELDSSTSVRLHSWQRSLEVIAEHPALGVGWEGFRFLNDLEPLLSESGAVALGEGLFDRYPYAINSFLEVGTVGGVPAILLLCALALWLVAAGYRCGGGREGTADPVRVGPLQVAFLGGFLAFFVFLQFDWAFVIGTSSAMVLFWINAGLLAALSRARGSGE